MQPRAERILDAAIQVAGAGGMRALTHRAVDAEAGLAAGSTSNLYRTRGALVRAMVDRIVAVEIAGWERVAGTLTPTNPDELADALTELVVVMTGPARTLTAARFALFGEAIRDAELQRRIAGAAARIAEWGQQWLALVGSRDPQGHTQIVLAYLDGLILHRLAYPEPAWDVAPAIRTLLRSLIAR